MSNYALDGDYSCTYQRGSLVGFRLDDGGDELRGRIKYIVYDLNVEGTSCVVAIEAEDGVLYQNVSGDNIVTVYEE